VVSLVALTFLMLRPVSDSGASAAERDQAQRAGGEFTTTISVLPPGDRVQFTLTQDTVVFAPGDTSGVPSGPGAPSTSTIICVFERTASGGIRLVAFDRPSVVEYLRGPSR
jgi:hypothetical protein